MAAAPARASSLRITTLPSLYSTLLHSTSGYWFIPRRLLHANHGMIHRQHVQGYGQFLCRQSFSSVAAGATTKVKTTVLSVLRQPIQKRWSWLARMVRYLRIPFLVLSVYGLGYQQGIIEYASNPTLQRQNLLQSVLADVGCHDNSQVDAVSDNDYAAPWIPTSLNRKLTRRVANVGRKVLVMANRLVHDNITEAAAKVLSRLPHDVSQEQYLQALSTDDEFIFWIEAKQRLDGDWTYVLVDTPLANAFISAFLPQHLFITTAMLSGVISNDDELALILGHELSHVILGHGSEKIRVGTMLRTIEILLLSMDPTEGFLSLGVVGGLATLRTAFAADHSRENERLADDMGIKLAAMACFDTERASRVFQRMQDLSKGTPTGRRLLSFTDSHPSSADRHERLLQVSATENAGKYSATTCATIKRRLFGLFAAQE